MLAGAQPGALARRHDDDRADAGDRDPRARRRASGASPSTRRSRAATSARATPRSRSWSAATPTRSRACSRSSRSWARTSSTRAAPGAGQHTKMCNQIVIAGTMIGVCESLVYAHQAGARSRDDAAVDSQRRGRLLDAREPGAARAQAQLRSGLHRRALHQGHGHRAGRSAEDALALPGLALVHQLYVAVQAQGHGRGGTQALVLALEHISNLPRGADAGARQGS